MNKNINRFHVKISDEMVNVPSNARMAMESWRLHTSKRRDANSPVAEAHSESSPQPNPLPFPCFTCRRQSASREDKLKSEKYTAMRSDTVRLALFTEIGH